MAHFIPTFVLETLLEEVNVDQKFDHKWSSEQKRLWLKYNVNEARRYILSRAGVGPMRWKHYLASFRLKESYILVDDTIMTYPY